MTQKQRAAVLQRYRNDDSAPRTLVVSNVGATGLNLDVANILIIIVRVIPGSAAKLNVKFPITGYSLVSPG